MAQRLSLPPVRRKAHRLGGRSLVWLGVMPVGMQNVFVSGAARPEASRHFDKKTAMDSIPAIAALNGWSRMNIALRTWAGGNVRPCAATG